MDKEDLIRRRDAIKAYNDAMDELVKAEMEEFDLADFTECEFNTTQCKLIARKIEAIPAVEPKQGEWIDDGFCLTCSECGIHFIGGDLNFCPNCGARMKGADDE